MESVAEYATGASSGYFFLVESLRTESVDKESFPSVPKSITVSRLTTAGLTVSFFTVSPNRTFGTVSVATCACSDILPYATKETAAARKDAILCFTFNS